MPQLLGRAAEGAGKMKKLKQLIMEIKRAANEFPINRSTYAEITDRIVPNCHIVIPKNEQTGAAWDIVREAELIYTSDWLDMAVYRAALNQARHAFRAALEDEG